VQKFKGLRLKRPCGNCPFRYDVVRFLTPGRYKELAHSLIDRGLPFSCHKTVNYEAPGRKQLQGAEQCAGAMIFLLNCGVQNQMMQVMQRLGVFDPDTLDRTAPVYRTRKEFENG
jgi:hypothetical protein